MGTSLREGAMNSRELNAVSTRLPSGRPRTFLDRTRTIVLGLCCGIAVLAACAQAAPVCPPPPPPAPCDRDLAPIAVGPKPTIDDPLHPKDAEPPAVVAAVSSGGATDAGPADGSTATAAPKDGGPTVAVAKPATPKPATPDPSSCGTKDNLCPLQKMMRGEMAGASTGPALAAAFAHVGNLSPNGGWSWRAISAKGAELAKAGDTAGAKQQCKACHDAYKEPYKASFRAKAVH